MGRMKEVFQRMQELGESEEEAYRNYLRELEWQQYEDGKTTRSKGEDKTEVHKGTMASEQERKSRDSSGHDR